jgi:hypothetical protein
VRGTLGREVRDALKRCGNDVVHVVQFFLCDHVWWKDVDHVPERPKKHAFAQIKLVQRGTQLGEVARIIGLKFEGHNRADHAHVGNAWVRRKRGGLLPVNSFDCRDALENRFGIEDFQAGYACGLAV